MKRDVRLILEENANSTPLEGVTDVGTISINNVIGGVLEEAVTAVAKVAPLGLFSSPICIISSGDCIASIPGTEGGYIWKPDGTSIANAWASNHSYTVGDIVKHTDTELNLTAGYACTTSHTSSSSFDDDIENWEKLNYPVSDNAPMILRMLSVYHESWLRPVVELTPLSSPYVSIARSDMNMSAGCEEKPLAVDSFIQKSSGAIMPTIELYPVSINKNIHLTYIEQVKVRNVAEGSTYIEKINCDAAIYQAAVFYAAYLVASMKGFSNAEAYKAEAMASLAMPVTNNNLNATAGAEV